MGSTRYCERQAAGPVPAALVMDPGGAILDLPQSDGARIVTALNRYVGDVSDHHVFRLDEVSYLFLSCGCWEHYHRATDTPDRLDYPKMAAIASLGVTLESRGTSIGWRGS